jgi:predicted ATPase
MSRLDRLATAKRVAQIGATIGRQFSYELLQAVSQLDETLLQHELARLVGHASEADGYRHPCFTEGCGYGV